MKVIFLSWFLFILCTQFVTILGFKASHTSKIEDFNISKPRFGGQLHVRETGVNATNGLQEETDSMELKGKEEIVNSVKGKGKGAYGGGNDAHHPRSDKGAASLSATPCYLISAAVLHVSLALTGLSLPYFLTGF